MSPDELLIERAAMLIIQARYAIALTGAGISTPSGIPDFRTSRSGLWEKYDPMLVANISNFKHHPELFYDWITPLIEILLEAQPNPAHLALAQLETLGKLNSIITQNIDMLHTKAGSQTVHEVHGHLREATCIQCFTVFPAEPFIRQVVAADLSHKVPYCPKCHGILKPNVILYGEQLPYQPLEASERDTRHCDVMLIAGSSLEVYPVADFPRKAHARGAKLIIINYDSTIYDKAADVVIHGDVAAVLPRIAAAVEANLA